MTNQEEDVIDSALRAENIQRYLDALKCDGSTLVRETLFLLTTRGRRTGNLRRTILHFGRDGEEYVIVASGAGSAEHPYWYENLIVDPVVTMQIRNEVFSAMARIASPEEKDRLWPAMVLIWPEIEKYKQEVARSIPVVILSRV